MIYVSFMEIIPKAHEALTASTTGETGSWLTAGGFFAGILMIAIIDRCVPDEKNPHEVKKVEEMNAPRARVLRDNPELLKMGTLTALAIAIHNFPEASPRSLLLCMIHRSGSRLPLPSPSITSRKGLLLVCRSTMQPAVVGKRLSYHSCQG